MVRSSKVTRSGFIRITIVEFFDQFSGVQVRGGFPGIVGMIIVAPLDEVVDRATYSLGI